MVGISVDGSTLFVLIHVVSSVNKFEIAPFRATFLITAFDITMQTFTQLSCVVTFFHTLTAVSEDPF